MLIEKFLPRAFRRSPEGRLWMPDRYLEFGPAAGGAPVDFYNTPSGASAYIDGSSGLLVVGSSPTSPSASKTYVDTATAQALSGKTLAGADGIVKVQPVTGTKTLVSGAAYAAFTTQVPALGGCAGIVFWSAIFINATDIQVDTFHTTYAVVNKAGTLTLTHTYVSAEEAKAVSTGTLTWSATATDSTGGLATFNVTPTSSITPTTLQLSFTVFPLIGAVTIL